MTKHTQGKWEIMPRENLPPRIKSKSFGIICRLNDIFPTEHGYQENEANARLIAAAPELLDELKESTYEFTEVLLVLQDMKVLEPDIIESLWIQIERNKKAIAKAKGA